MRKRNKGRLNPRKRGARKAWMFSIISAGILALVFLAASMSGQKESAQAEGAGSAPASTIRESEGAEANELRMKLSDTLYSQSRHIKGDPTAPVTIIEFSDFQ